MEERFHFGFCGFRWFLSSVWLQSRVSHLPAPPIRAWRVPGWVQAGRVLKELPVLGRACPVMFASAQREKIESCRRLSLSAGIMPACR